MSAVPLKQLVLLATLSGLCFAAPFLPFADLARRDDSVASICDNPNVSWDEKYQAYCGICNDKSKVPQPVWFKYCMRWTPYVSHEPAHEVWRRDPNIVLPGPANPNEPDTWPKSVPPKNTWGYTRPVLPPRPDFHPVPKFESAVTSKKRSMPIMVDPNESGSSVAPSIHEAGGLPDSTVPTTVLTKARPKPMLPMGHGPVLYDGPIHGDNFHPLPNLPRDELVARDEVTHMPTTEIYSAFVSDAGSDDHEVHDHPSARSKNEHGGIISPQPAIRPPLFTLPVEKPTYDAWRRDSVGESNALRERNVAGPLPIGDLGVIVTHEPADAIWRRSDESIGEKRDAKPVPPSEFFQDEHYPFAPERRDPGINDHVDKIKNAGPGDRASQTDRPRKPSQADSKKRSLAEPPIDTRSIDWDSHKGPIVFGTPYSSLRPAHEVYRRNAYSTLLNELLESEHKPPIARRDEAEPSATRALPIDTRSYFNFDPKHRTDIGTPYISLRPAHEVYRRNAYSTIFNELLDAENKPSMARRAESIPAPHAPAPEYDSALQKDVEEKRGDKLVFKKPDTTGNLPTVHRPVWGVFRRGE